MTKNNPLEEPEVSLTPVEAMSDDQLLESLHQAFHFLEGVPAIGAEVLERVVESLSEIVPEVTEAVSDLMEGSGLDGDSHSENPDEA